MWVRLSWDYEGQVRAVLGAQDLARAKTHLGGFVSESHDDRMEFCLEFHPLSLGPFVDSFPQGSLPLQGSTIKLQHLFS